MFYEFIIPIVGFLGYFILLLAFVMRSIIALRLLSLISSVCMIVYFYYYATLPLWINIFWEGLFFAVNLGRLSLLIYEKNRIYFTPEALGIYQKYFSSLSSLQFNKLLKAGAFANAEENEVLIEQGSQVVRLILICQGTASVWVDEKRVAYCQESNFLGEMNFLSGKPATATVKASQPLRYLMWPQKDLKKLLEADNEIDQMLRAILSQDLVRKLQNPMNEIK